MVSSGHSNYPHFTIFKIQKSSSLTIPVDEPLQEVTELWRKALITSVTQLLLTRYHSLYTTTAQTLNNNFNCHSLAVIFSVIIQSETTDTSNRQKIPCCLGKQYRIQMCRHISVLEFVRTLQFYHRLSCQFPQHSVNTSSMGKNDKSTTACAQK